MKHPLLEKALLAQQRADYGNSKTFFLNYLEIVPDDAQAYYLLGMVCNQKSEFQQSIDYIQKAIQLNPSSAQYLLGLGLSYDQYEQTDLAEQAYRSAETLRPDVFQVHFDIGCFMQKYFRYKEAAEYFKKTIELNSKHYPAYTNLANAYKQMGDLKQAESYSRKIVALVPDNVQLINNLAKILIDQENYSEAKQLLEKALKLNANSVAVQTSYGWFNYLVNNKSKAQNIFENILQVDSQNFKVQSMLAKCLIDDEQFEPALELLKLAVGLSSEYLGTILALAELYALQENFKESVATYCRGLEQHPNSTEILYGLGIVYSQQGQFDIANQYFLKSLKVNQKYTQALHAVTKTTEYNNFENKEVEFALELLDKVKKDPETLTTKQQIDLYFSLGKIYDDLKAFNDAFQNYQKGNQLRYKKFPYDISEFIKFNRETINNYSPLTFEKTIETVDQNILFIVGMPRSGTTLLEQILSSHSEIFGVGELYEIQKIAKRINNFKSFETLYEDNNLKKLRRQYTDKLETLRQNKKMNWVVDKNPINYRFIGIIKLLFPNAKIIHMQRHPLDCLLSIYFQRLSEGHKYAFNLESLSQYYIKYQELMNFWEMKFPEDIISCRYDKLIEDTQATVTRILEKLDLNWQQGCNEFYKLDRKVATASSWQVRQPIHSGSIARWKHYQKYLIAIENQLADYILKWNNGANI